MRGIHKPTAVLVFAEPHDVQRFPAARVLTAYLVAAPGEHSGETATAEGAITKTRNTLARRLLLEAGRHYRHRPPGIRRTLAQRRSGQPDTPARYALWRRAALG